METILQAIVIGIVQGLTEFLPISSSAHLILLPQLLGWDDPFLNSAAFDVMLHMGTLVGAGLLLLARPRAPHRGGLGGPPRPGASAATRTGGWPGCCSSRVIPAALLGAALEDFFDTFFRDMPIAIAGLVLVVGAGALWLGERLGRRAARRSTDLRLRDAIVIGGAQALALFPGISRSGITIAAGLFLGLEREAAARFAFLMGIPIIAGAGLWKMRDRWPAAPVDFEPLRAAGRRDRARPSPASWP